MNRSPSKARAYRLRVRHTELGIIKRSAQRAFYKAVRRGIIIRPDKCSKCGKSCRPVGHHEDYAKRFDVVWLCNICHAARHRELARAALTRGEVGTK